MPKHSVDIDVTRNNMCTLLHMLLKWFTWFMVLFMSTSSLAADIQWTYQEVKNSGKFCPERDSCSSEWWTQGAEHLSWKSRNCFCDKDCSLYGDCCIDAETFDHNEQKENFGSFSCVPVRQHGLVYMRTKCSSDWPAGQIRTGCEDQPSSSRSDPVGTLPVTSGITGITYSNYYCAVCNQDSIGGQLWKLTLDCPSLQEFNKTNNFIRENIEYNEGKSQWGVELITNGNPVFHACYVALYVPHNLTPRPRPCLDPRPHHS
eukprot:GFUD01042132.1.p1 GENE.GFUD01042132.1~~GFUD01042132.1.p1  ORF type:complete len:260 (-),score=53.51 GFUD01042132.1:24-803(-)